MFKMIFGAWTWVLEDLISEEKNTFRCVLPLKLDSKRTNYSLICSVIKISSLQVKYNVYCLIRTLHLLLMVAMYLDNS